MRRPKPLVRRIGSVTSEIEKNTVHSAENHGGEKIVYHTQGLIEGGLPTRLF